MKKVLVSKREFDDFLWPAFGLAAPKDIAVLDTTVSTLKKLKEVSKADPVTPTLRTLTEDRVTFAFEDAEHKLLCDMLKGMVKHIRSVVADDFQSLYTRFDKAPEYKGEGNEEQ